MSEADAGGAGGGDAAGHAGGDALAPGFLARIGLAIVQPRWALAVAGDRRVAGRSGSDLIALIAIVLAATQLQLLVSAVWLGGAIDAGLGLSMAMRSVTQALVGELCFLVLGAFVLWLGAGPRRDLGRAFDLACVAAIPQFLVMLAAAVILRVLDARLPAPAVWLARAAAWSWSGALVALAWRQARLAARTARATPNPPRAIVRTARRAGVGVALAAVAGVALHVAWIAQHLDLMRPVEEDGPAPAFALPAIGPGGAPGPVTQLQPGRVTVLDFWATWCGPCIQSMPRLAALAAEHPDLDVLAINLDDPAAARALLDQRGWTKLRLLADDGAVSQRYNVTTIPHTVVIDRDGVVRHVLRGASASLPEAVRALLRK